MGNFTVIIEKDEEVGMYVGEVVGLPGCHTQGKDIDELMKNMREVIELCLEANAEKITKLPKFVGLQQIEVPAQILNSGVRMSRLYPIPPKKLEKKLFSIGFEKIRIKGSHAFYRHPDGRSTTIPFHGNIEIGPVLLGKILKEIKVSRDEYVKM